MKSLLIVEDDSAIGSGLQEAFIEYGYNVTWLDRGDTAQKALKAHNFDIIILDITLPVVSGLILAQSLRDNHDTTPIIIVTAEERDQIQTSCDKAEVNAIFGKPFDTDKLFNRVEELLPAKVS